MSNSKQLPKEKVQAFALAGNATITILNPNTGNRFTYKIRQKTNEDGTKTPHFVSLLRGNDNENDFSYIGFIRNNTIFIHGGRKAKASKDAQSVKAFEWFWRNRNKPEPIEVYHEGRCARCGRKLTVPESIESGFGPQCAQALEI